RSEDAGSIPPPATQPAPPYHPPARVDREEDQWPPRLRTCVRRSPLPAMCARSATTSPRRTGGTTPTGSSWPSTALGATPRRPIARRAESMTAVNTDYLGREFSGTPPYGVSRAKIAEFAAAVGATSALHVDPGAARAAGYSDVLAPPTFAVLIAQRAEAEYVDDPAAGIDFSRVVHAEES